MNEQHDDRPPLRVVIEAAAKPVVVRVEGEIDIETSGQLASDLKALPVGGLEACVVFDLSEVPFIDSSGLAVLISVARGGRHVVVRGASTVVRRVIAATGLSDVLLVEP